MRLLVIGINYAPEPVSTGKYTSEMCEWMASRGHQVRVITAPPYYPGWKIWPGFEGLRYRREHRNGVDVIRCPMWVPARPRGVARLVHLGTFAASSMGAMLWSTFWRPDAVMCIAPTLASAPAALLVGRACAAETWLHVQDFEVDAAFDMGLVNAGALRRAATAVEAWLVRRFNVVSTISRQMCIRLGDKGVLPDRQFLFNNWVDTDTIRPLGRPSTYRSTLSIPEDGVVVLYSGSMGLKQGLELLADTARALSDRNDVFFVFGGEGPGRAGLESACNGLPNVRFAALQPTDQLSEWLGLADIHVMPQRADVSDLVLPSKLTGMLASGRPIIATAPEGSGVAEAIRACGVSTPPGSAEAFASAIREMAGNPTLRQTLGQRARELAVTRLGVDAVLGELERRMLALVGRARLPDYDQAA